MQSDSRPPWFWPRAAYIHVPFCAHHCGYCDFAVVTNQDHKIDLYIEALAAEMATLGEPQPVRTVFIGGGTPSYLDAPRLDRLFTEILRWLPLAEDHEFTIEANPNSIDPDKIAVMAHHGVNRLSMGAQSFQTHSLHILERDHVPDDVRRAMAWARGRIAQVSLDLIFGVPGQSLADWDVDLRLALVLEPDHVSTYGLTYEKGTRLWKQRERQEVRPLAEEEELALYCHALDTLEGAGFESYEISNHARPGKRCRHNETYWANEAYFGFGMGAARYVEGRRELNTRSFPEYLRRALAGEPATFQSEALPPLERAKETLALQLRRSDGVNRPSFLTQTGYELDIVAGAAIGRHVELGLLSDDGVNVRLTRQGKCVADSVIQNLF